MNRFILIKKYLQIFLFGFLMIGLIGCGGGGSTDPVTQDQLNLSDQGDPDGDGLSNADERRFGTSIYLADTDGDGRPDSTEVKEGDFKTYNAALIAAFPNMKVSLASPVKLYLDYTNTEGETVTEDHGLTTTDSLSSSTSRSSSESDSISHGWNVDVRADVTIGLSGGATFGVSAGANGQYSTDTSTTVDIGNVRDVSTSIDKRISNTSSFDKTYSNAQLKFTVKVKNISKTLGLDVKNFNINIRTLYRGKSVVLASAYVPEGKNDSAVLQPGEESDELEFIAYISGQEYDYIKGLNSSFFDISIASADIEGVSIIGASGFQQTFDIATIYTNMQNRTSLLEVNYFDGVKDPKKVSIASSRQYDAKGDYLALSMLEWLDVAGAVKLDFDDQGTLNGVDDVKVYDNALWGVAVYEFNDKAEYILKEFITSNQETFMKDYQMKAGIKVIFSRGVDPDNDGIISYYETYKYKTDPNKYDTDGDGIGDIYEVLGYKPEAVSTSGDQVEKFASPTKVVSNPLKTDSDGDKLSDSKDLYPLVKLRSDYADLKSSATFSLKKNDLLLGNNITQFTLSDDENQSHSSRITINNIMGNIHFKVPCKAAESQDIDEAYVQKAVSIDNQKANKQDFTLDGKVAKVVLSRKLFESERVDGDTQEWNELHSVTETVGGECSYVLSDMNIASLGDYQYKIDVYSHKNTFFGENPKKTFYVATNFQGEISSINVVDLSVDTLNSDGSVGSYAYQFKLQVELDKRYDRVKFIDYDDVSKDILVLKETLENGNVRYTSDIIKRQTGNPNINTNDIAYEVYDSHNNRIIAKRADVKIDLQSYDFEYRFIGLSAYNEHAKENSDSTDHRKLQRFSSKLIVQDINKDKNTVNGIISRHLGTNPIVTKNIALDEYSDYDYYTDNYHSTYQMTQLGTDGTVEPWNSIFSGKSRYSGIVSDVTPESNLPTTGFRVKLWTDYLDDNRAEQEYYTTDFIFDLTSNSGDYPLDARVLLGKQSYSDKENYINYSQDSYNNSSVYLSPHGSANNGLIYFYKHKLNVKAYNYPVDSMYLFFRVRYIPKKFDVTLKNLRDL